MGSSVRNTHCRVGCVQRNPPYSAYPSYSTDPGRPQVRVAWIATERRGVNNAIAEELAK